VNEKEEMSNQVEYQYCMETVHEKRFEFSMGNTFVLENKNL